MPRSGYSSSRAESGQSIPGALGPGFHAEAIQSGYSEVSDMIADGLAFLTTQLSQNASQIVTYADDTRSVDVHAAFGKKLLKVDDGSGGLRIEWTDMDFLIPATELILPGDSFPHVPERGNRIFVVMPYDVQTFEVFPFGNEPPWRWADPHQTMYRIHTKYIDSEQFT